MLNHIDPIMHLIFYGVGGSTVEEVKLFLTKRERHSNFKTIANVLTKQITPLNVSWCKLLAYKEGTFGGWIAENWIACMRIVKWVLAGIPVIAANVKYVQPNSAIKK